MKSEKIFRIGELIRKVKEEKKITNKEISRNLNVSEQAISKVIRNLRNGKSCNLLTLIKIIEELNLEIFIEEKKNFGFD